ncbi:MAG: hypothetical protein J5950_05795 [Clostridia bacterium]|nr:hypothetical protein [Clostridia bacterium]
MKRNKLLTWLTIALAASLMLAMCSCGLFGGGNNTAKDVNAHEKLISEVSELAETAAMQYDVGLTFRSEYMYGIAQAEISSLRLCIDYVLWLRGEGANLAEVIGDAPYKTWNEIVAAGPGSSAPFYFEGLIYKFRGDKTNANKYFEMAGYNPLNKDRDFYYLRNLSIEKLYSIKAEAAELESKIYRQYTPRTALLAEPTGAEFLSAYHLAMANEREANAAEAAQCMLNALLTDPMTPSLYGNAAAYELSAGNVGLAVEILNEGLFLAPEDASINYIAAMFAYSSGDNVAAKTYLDTAKAGADGELLNSINALYAQIGG